MRFLSFLIFSFLFFVTLPVYSQIPKDMQQELDNGVNDLKKQIAQQEKQIVKQKKIKKIRQLLKKWKIS
jgi:hypothetical protein